MDEVFMKTKIIKQSKPIETKIIEQRKPMETKETQYEYAGYQVQVHFAGEKTLMQCMQNLIARENES